ncbi:related to integral membrane protein PTH11 [Fusarium fujikuroi IMI 58289]|uniref:Related to integral membrane protein PTH11 n=1 Tax=Gibberella fujikuroi (strain CBS 195.34 / IMI 58289 / NRRL A-6831) TaxID=1279085 RepID=S0EAQ3_GIBF5|nr:related to integral membrane protein PTH11 [Fusarium fujikuroi IMI 58289]CCT71730.1 related to integral membrane protein PTH11 [Fusarium fujikuroi IMI 58289]SCO20628.1 related to integral membrane protein PTH11 [Fusarium fujikuroi]
MHSLPPDVAAHTRGPAMMAVMYSLTTLSSLAVVGRVFSRYKKLGRLAIDDYVIILSLGFVFAYVACWTAAILAGSGRHQATLTVDEFHRSVFFLMIGLIPGVLSLALPKFAVVNLLVKILFPSPRHVRLLWGLAIANLVLMLGAFGVRFSECDPPEAQFTLYAPAKCRSSTAIIVYSVIVGSFSAVVDFYLALYPAVVLWSLQLHLKKKLALSVALGFGVCAGCAAIRKVMMVPGMGDGKDYTYASGSLVIWISVETNCVIIAACIPMLLPFFELLFGKRFLSAPPPSSLSRISDSKPGSRTGNLSGTNKTVETERRRIRDEVEERMEAVLLLEEPGQDEEGGQSQRADNVRQRRLQHT